MVCGSGGRRSLKCAEFTTGIFQTELAPGEIIESVRIPKLSADARWGYVKLCRKSGEFANALAVVVADRRRGHSRVVSVPPMAHRWCSTTRRGLFPRAGRGDRSGTPIAADLDRAADRHFDEFQRNLHEVAAMRAVQQVLQ